MTPEQFENQLIKHEGLVLKMYNCPAGYLTIGVGHNLEALGISEKAARQILQDDLEMFAEQLAEKFPVVKGLDAVRYYTLLNLAFNIGIGGIEKFRKMWAAVESGDYNEAANQMHDSRWRTQVGRRADELIAQMRTGEYVD
jgi:lysozyme